ncbi:hypothetical protein [Halobacillus karajensis]|uniref:Uncharacterized protein n=1 Tax=Halobacillus karajensis TaxID=195088 RepID=A0A024P381_9BACI|nr:hypothetical protein [Halobacillus karajensis]CDQ20029.1 hypothetical protein BN982_02337 [Halobacillus karajensis]CDQ22488.1 hypothetical protein BN983_00697 [Halobacillus karajensis]CDQ28332.1 hypothetical protein BN981_02627 [Halobacillus karajensis]
MKKKGAIMEKRLQTLRYIDIVILLVGAIYLLLVGVTEKNLSIKILMTICLSNTLIRGIEAQWNGRKIASFFIYGFSLFLIFVLII